MEGKKKECHICKKWLIGRNLSRYMRTVNGPKTEEGTLNEVTARLYREKHVVHDECWKTVLAANLVLQQKSTFCI